MNYSIPTLSSPIDPILYDWVYTLPEPVRQNPCLMNFLMRVGSRIYEGNGFDRSSYINPFYKIIELLNAPKLEFWHLQKLNEYYHFDIIHYLTSKNLGEYYLGYPCNNVTQLRNALGIKKNITDECTLTKILSAIV